MNVSLLKRFSAIFYDTVIIIALLFVATALALPFIAHNIIDADNWFFKLYLACCIFLFFGYSWIKAGQTIGMKAWKIRLISLDNKPLTWKKITIYFFSSALSWALLGFGFWIAVFRKDKRCLHDVIAKTKLISITNTKY